MKTCPNRLLQVALAFTVLTGGVAADAVAGADTVSLCKSFQEFHVTEFDNLYGNLGQCVSFFRTYPVDTCQLLKEYDLLASFGYASQGECVVNLSS
jgi:hypothetical protein